MRLKKKVTGRTIFLAIIWASLVLFALSFLSSIASRFEVYPESRNVVSLTWAGYIISQLNNPEFAVTAIESSWTVPKVNASAVDGYSSAWIGIGGQIDRTLIQVGTEHDLIDGKECYYSWYEMLPDFSIKINEMTIAPGDTIFASLMLIDSLTNQWNIQLSDLTNGQSFNTTVNYFSTCSSGEWIMERPTVNGQIEILSDFGAVHFTNSKAYANNIKGAISNFTYSRVEMVNEQIEPLTLVSLLHPKGESFTVGFVEKN